MSNNKELQPILGENSTEGESRSWRERHRKWISRGIVASMVVFGAAYNIKIDKDDAEIRAQDNLVIATKLRACQGLVNTLEAGNKAPTVQISTLSTREQEKCGLGDVLSSSPYIYLGGYLSYVDDLPYNARVTDAIVQLPTESQLASMSNEYMSKADPSEYYSPVEAGIMGGGLFLGVLLLGAGVERHRKTRNETI